MTDLPTWEQRIRAPQLMSRSLLGPAIVWADGTSDRGVLLANPTGRTEVYAFDASSTPAVLTRITDRPQGTMGASVSRDGSTALWFDDHAGDEVGRWQASPVSGGHPTVLLPDLPPAYPGGIVPLSDGRVVVGRLLDAGAGGDVGFEIAVASADGSGVLVHGCGDPAELVDVSHDAALALVAFAPGGNWLRLGIRVVRLSDGEILHELLDEGRSLNPEAFHPGDAGLVLLGHERRDFQTPAVWDLATGEQIDVEPPAAGDVTASWYPDGSALLLTLLREARHELYRHDRASGGTGPVLTPVGTVARASARPDGSVHVLLSRSDVPVSLIRCRDGASTAIVALPGDGPAAAQPAHSLWVEGLDGPIHALVVEPPTRARPHATLFVPHGGPTAQDLDAWNDVIAAYVDAGYAVVRVNYRGSTGYGAAWRDALHGRLGFIELEDIDAVRTHLEAEGVVDPDRVSITGGSWGGFLTLMAVGTQPDRWRSGAALVPLADQVTSAEDSPSFMKAYDAALMGGTIEEIPDVYRAASPITYADAVTAPLLVTAGENDPRCPVRQVDTYVERLRARGHDVHYERVATGHALADLDLKVDEVRQILEFFAKTLPVEEPG